MSDNDKELLERHWQTNQERLEKAQTMSDRAQIYGNLATLEKEFRKRGLEVPDSAEGTAVGSSSSGSPGSALDKVKAAVRDDEQAADLFNKLTGPERVRLYREDQESFLKLSRAARRVNERRLIGY